MRNPFDELAKTLAKAKEMPRRDALRLIGGGLAGGVLAAFGVGKVLAQGHGNLGNSPCAHFCVDTFPPGPERGACVSAGAHGEGACFECGGPFGPPGFSCGDTIPICGTGGIDICFCGSTAEGGTACVDDEFCIDFPTCTTSADCTSGQRCIVNTCCGAPICLPLCDNPGVSSGTNTVSRTGLTALG